MSRITSLLSILVILFLYGCQNNQSKEPIKIDKPTPFPTVLDTIGIYEFIHRLYHEDSTYLTTAKYSFHYLGKIKDSIYLHPYIIFENIELPPLPGEKEVPILKSKSPYSRYYIEWTEERNYCNWESSNIDIQVNTSGKIADSYAVMLINKESDTVSIGYGEVLPIIMEAKDKKGNWRPIQQRFTYMCGNGVGTIILPPNEIAITLAPIFKGDYKTQLRLKYGKNYSKPFEGNIHYSQFEYEKRY